MSRVKPVSSEQAKEIFALNPDWGVTATRLVKVTVPRGTLVWEGPAAAQGILPGGAVQTFISKDYWLADWFQFDSLLP
jgi:hypothetical protein